MTSSEPAGAADEPYSGSAANENTGVSPGHIPTPPPRQQEQFGPPGGLPPGPPFTPSLKPAAYSLAPAPDLREPLFRRLLRRLGSRR
jgi:hypothetical protein